MLLFFPETQRNIVGDGSGRASGIYWSLFTLFQSPSIRKNRPDTLRPKWRFPNPCNAFPILRQKNSLVVILMYSATYTVKMTLQASLGVQAREIYGLDSLAAGLIYIPSGVASGLGALGTGYFLNWMHKRAKGKLGNAPDGTLGHAVSTEFPFERVRLPGIYLLTTIGALGTFGYGLALLKKAVWLTGPSWFTFHVLTPLLAHLRHPRPPVHHGPDNSQHLCRRTPPATVSPL